MSESLRECVFCGNQLGSQTQHVCPRCGGPQPVPPNEDFFSLLGVPRGFRQDLPALEKRFYEISRTLHPDRFAAGAAPAWKTISVERMSALNQAYQTLMKKDALRDYLLELEGIESKKASDKPQIPMELAEEWFELQDAVMESPESAVEKLGAFGQDLKSRSADLRKRIEALEDRYDEQAKRQSPDADRRETLGKIQKLALDGQYLKSMERDLLRLQSRLGI